MFGSFKRDFEFSDKIEAVGSCSRFGSFASDPSSATLNGDIVDTVSVLINPLREISLHTSLYLVQTSLSGMEGM